MAIHTGSRSAASSSPARRTGPAAASLVIRRRAPSRSFEDGGKAARSRRRCTMEVRRKMEELRRLVPSGSDDGEEGADGRCLDADELLLHAAGYIARLQAQVQVMQLMVDVLECTKD
ncbi:hypothetical protein ACP70R_041317 [Stipagrostis hirtigluma subsp. patula]